MDEDKKPLQPSQQQINSADSQPRVSVMPTLNIQTEEPTTQETPKRLYFLAVLGPLLPLPIGLIFLIYLVIKKYWELFFITLASYQVLGVGIFFLMMASISGQTGSEFVALMLYATLVPTIALISLINLVSLPIYLFRYQPRGKRLALGIFSLLVSLLIFSYGAFSLYQTRVALPQQFDELSNRDKSANSLSLPESIAKIQNCEVESLIILKNGGSYPALLNIKSQETNAYVSKADLSSVQQTIKDSGQKCSDMRVVYENDSGDLSVVSAISIDQATSLLTTCKIEQVRMPMDKKYLSKAELRALNETGIYMAEGFDGTPIAIGFNESARSKITPIARQAKSQCKGMSFMLSPGNWAQGI